MNRTKTLAVLLAALAFGAVGCGGESTDGQATTPKTKAEQNETSRDRPGGHHRDNKRRAEPVAGTYPARRLLKSIKVAPESSAATYSRAAFKHWVEQHGCNTRQDVLIQERRKGATTDCKIKSGKWFSAYDGETFTDASRLDIDHFVPLAQAYVSGAGRWSFATRTDFANDLGYLGSLIAVSAASNRSKGAQDPSDWMPPRIAFRCRYVGTWIAVKYRWRLTADKAEFNALRSWTKRCGSSANVRKPKRARIKLGGNKQSKSRSQRSKKAHEGANPRFSTCKDAKAHGYGPYRKGVDPEFHWYRDADGDGFVCE